MKHIAKIDIQKFKKITDNITTDEVVLTNNQIQHIKEHHPKDYETYCCFIKKIIEEPDYIMCDRHPYTAILIKKFMKYNKNFEIVLRLHTNKDIFGYKNSIITFLKIGNKKYEQYVRNKKIVYISPRL